MAGRPVSGEDKDRAAYVTALCQCYPAGAWFRWHPDPRTGGQHVLLMGTNTEIDKPLWQMGQEGAKRALAILHAVQGGPNGEETTT